MGNSKIETYFGFCVRARKAVFGTDDIESQKKGVKLIVCDNSLSENSLKKIYKAQERFHCPLLMAETDCLGELLHKPAVKAVGIKDEHLAAAILVAAEHEPKFKFYSGGNN